MAVRFLLIFSMVMSMFVGVLGLLQFTERKKCQSKIRNLTQYCTDQYTLVIPEAAHTICLSKLPSENFVFYQQNLQLLMHSSSILLPAVKLVALTIS